MATPKTLERAAYAYLARYAAPANHLRRILLARVARSARVHGTDPGEGATAVEALIARLSDLGYLDDSAYALAMARRLFRRGTSLTGIRARLRAKGVGAEDANAARIDSVGTKPASGDPCSVMTGISPTCTIMKMP